MNFNELSTKRASCRGYQEKQIDREIISEVLKDAIKSPSACNSQPWKFVVCDGEKAKEFSKFIKQEGSPINQWTSQVPCFIIVCETKAKLMSILTCDSQHYAQYDAGIAAATICYSATDKGLGSCIIGLFDSDGIKEYMGIPDDVKISMLITLGYPKNDSMLSKKRKDFDEMVSFGNW